jgi:hypothetical protein
MPTGIAHKKSMTGAARSGRANTKSVTAISDSLVEGDPLFLTLQQVRANLKLVCDGGRVVVIGNKYNTRALVIPCGPHRYLSGNELRERWERMTKQMQVALKLLFG